MSFTLYSKSKRGIISDIAGIIFLFFVFYIFWGLLPYTQNVDKQKIFKTNIHIQLDEESKENIKDLYIRDGSKDFYTNYLMDKSDIYAIYYSIINKIFVVNSSSPGNTYFHEYLHHLFFKRNLSSQEIDELLEFIESFPGQEAILNSVQGEHSRGKDIKVSRLTEYISYSYENYYDKCLDTENLNRSDYLKKQLDVITKRLVEEKLLPKTILCKNLSSVNKKDFL